MKSSLGLTALVLGFALALSVSGCKPHSDRGDHDGHAHESAGEEHEIHGAEFKAGKGISLPATTRQTLDVKLIEVTEGKMAREITMPVQIYRIEKGFAAASGTIDQEQAGEFTVGQAVTLRRKKDGESLAGKIIRIDQSSGKSSGLAEVVIQFSAPDSLAAGAFLQATLAVRPAEDVVTIPREALLRTATGHSVYVVNGEHFFRTEVKVGDESGDLVEIKEGLYTGDQVVRQPVLSLWLTELAAVRGGVGCTHGH